MHSMRSLVALLVAAMAAGAWSLRYPFLAEWKAFKLEHRKHYESKEENLSHLKMYLESRLGVALHNQRYARGEETCELALNRFADLSPQEFLFTAADSHQLAQRTRGKKLEPSELAAVVSSGKAGQLTEPLVVTLDAAHLAFTQYATGVYSPPCASPPAHNHAMLVVGHGAAGAHATGEYWVARGTLGLIKLARAGSDCALVFYRVSSSNVTA